SSVRFSSGLPRTIGAASLRDCLPFTFAYDIGAVGVKSEFVHSHERARWMKRRRIWPPFLSLARQLFAECGAEAAVVVGVVVEVGGDSHEPLRRGGPWHDRDLDVVALLEGLVEGLGVERRRG